MALYHRGDNQVETRDKKRDRLPRMIILYDGKTEILIVKLIVGVVHESAAREFASIFDLKLALLSIRKSIIAIGSARFGSPAGRSKEANVSYKSISRVMEDEWPSFVIEVDVEYDGPSLEIPAEKLFDRLPQNIPRGEFLFTPNKLNVFNTTMWEAFR
ncbi:unnamed protein product [Sphagnum troendelagicum]|uniref:Uncharacterized protein n=1 Tax=Sphagnum troendelagicum TaxID=128251 RepID=A0ABP0V2G3_9BRYO